MSRTKTFSVPKNKTETEPEALKQQQDGGTPSQAADSGPPASERDQPEQSHRDAEEQRWPPPRS